MASTQPWSRIQQTRTRWRRSPWKLTTSTREGARRAWWTYCNTTDTSRGCQRSRIKGSSHNLQGGSSFKPSRWSRCPLPKSRRRQKRVSPISQATSHGPSVKLPMVPFLKTYYNNDSASKEAISILLGPFPNLSLRAPSKPWLIDLSRGLLITEIIVTYCYPPHIMSNQTTCISSRPWQKSLSSNHSNLTT